MESLGIDMVVVGPEAPLVGGIVNFFNSRGYSRIFGPTQDAAALEADKFFSWEIMRDLNIPQAESIECFNLEEAARAVTSLANSGGVVLKARGLTGGKGVGVYDSRNSALEALRQHAQNYGNQILVAERLFGQEFSVFAVTDGTNVSGLEIAFQDHKPLFDGDRAPNTGGMGAYGPAPIDSQDVVRNVVRNIMTPVVREMKRRGMEYKGFLYAGMIMTEDGPRVLEFNARFGDPEGQPAMMTIKGDLYRHLSSALDGKLEGEVLDLNPGAACCVVLASQGYPGKYVGGLEITGLDGVKKIPGIKVFHAGTKLVDGKIVTDGGRVLGVTAYSPSGIVEARAMAYEVIPRIKVPGGFHFRKDIGEKALRQNVY